MEFRLQGKYREREMSQQTVQRKSKADDRLDWDRQRWWKWDGGNEQTVLSQSEDFMLSVKYQQDDDAVISIKNHG